VGEIFLCPFLINSPTRFARRGIKYLNSNKKISENVETIREKALLQL
jgi:hypothetical protein